MKTELTGKPETSRSNQVEYSHVVPVDILYQSIEKCSQSQAFTDLGIGTDTFDESSSPAVHSWSPYTRKLDETVGANGGTSSDLMKARSTSMSSVSQISDAVCITMDTDTIMMFSVGNGNVDGHSDTDRIGATTDELQESEPLLESRDEPVRVNPSTQYVRLPVGRPQNRATSVSSNSSVESDTDDLF